MTAPAKPSCDVVQHIFATLAATYPDTECFLDYTTPFSLLVAVVLSAQSTDMAVNRAMPAVRAVADTPEKMVALGEQGLHPLIRTIGLFRRKATSIVMMAQQLLDHHNGQVPACRDRLMTLAGVGRKTANVIMSVLHGHPTIAVDTHVFRVARRLGLSAGATPTAVEKDLEMVVPPAFLRRAHTDLIWHGRTVCKALKPACASCPLHPLCPSASVHL